MIFCVRKFFRILKRKIFCGLAACLGFLNLRFLKNVSSRWAARALNFFPRGFGPCCTLIACVRVRVCVVACVRACVLCVLVCGVMCWGERVGWAWFAKVLGGSGFRRFLKSDFFCGGGRSRLKNRFVFLKRLCLAF